MTRTCCLATLFAAVAAVPIVSAPTAAAAVTGLRVPTGPDGPLAGCAYVVAADVTAPPQPGEVIFYDHAVPIPGMVDFHPDSRTVSIVWTPGWQGVHMISVIQIEPGGLASGRAKPVEVVGNGVNTGSSCVRMP
ncbi:hypothetical protein [Nocardia sp. IFM 10818]